jgi:hypothetical protein
MIAIRNHFVSGIAAIPAWLPPQRVLTGMIVARMRAL